MINHVKFSVRQTFFRKTCVNFINDVIGRTYADTPKKGKPSRVTVHTESDERVRVRRARPGDVPLVLRFIRERTRDLWPGVTLPSNGSQIVLADYVSRALAQGHSMIAERQEPKLNWSKIVAMALGITVCKWDAIILEKWARCVQCPHSRQLLTFTAHCLRAPGLHEKYQVHNILQVILIVPPDIPHRKEIIDMLAKSAIQRGRDVGFTVIRFDAGNDAVVQTLEELQLQKEWQIVYDVLPYAIREREALTSAVASNSTQVTGNVAQVGRGHSLAVYTAFTDTHK